MQWLVPHTAKADGQPVQLSYWEAGDPAAHPVVLLVGLGMQAIEWPTEFIRQLSETRRVICIDNRDAGQSPRCGEDSEPLAAGIWMQGDAAAAQDLAPYSLFDMRDDVLALLDRLQIDTFDIIGFSMGGMISQLVAAAAGPRACSFVQLASNDGTAEVDGDADSKFRIARLFTRPSNPDLIRTYLLEDALAYGAGRITDTPELRSEVNAVFAAGYSCGGAARHALAVLTTPDRRQLLKSIQSRTLVLHGDRDSCISPQRGAAAATLIPDTRFELMPGVGHVLDPMMCDAALNWLEQAAGTRTRIGESHGVA